MLWRGHHRKRSGADRDDPVVSDVQTSGLRIQDDEIRFPNGPFEIKMVPILKVIFSAVEDEDSISSLAETRSNA